MASTALSFDCLGIDYKPSIQDTGVLGGNYMYREDDIHMFTLFPYFLFLSLYIHILSFPWPYVIMYSFRNLYSLYPANFRSLPHTPHLLILWLFSFTSTAPGSLPQLCSPSPVPPTLHPHSPLTQSQYLQHNSILSLHRHTQHCTFSLTLPFHTNLQFPTSTALDPKTHDKKWTKSNLTK